MNIQAAYRLKKGHDVWGVFSQIKSRAMTAVRTELGTLYTSWAEDAGMLITMVEEIESTNLPSPMTSGIMELICSMYCQKQYLKAIDEHTRMMHLTVSVTVRKLGGRYYLIPKCQGVLGKTLDFLDHDRSLEEFFWWHTESTPDNITPQAWQGRKKVWTRLLNTDMGYYSKANEFLTIDICSPESFDLVDPFMVKEVEA